MDVKRIVAELDTEIARLQKIRSALVEIEPAAPAAKRGRPRKNAAVAVPAPGAKVTPKKKRKLSPEGRKRIVDAMKKRWAAQRKQAAK